MSAIAIALYNARLAMTAPHDQPDEGDDALFARYRAEGSEDALAALLARHWPRAFRLAFRIVRDPALAEDVAQEAFVKLARAGDGYKERGRFASFLGSVVIHEARNALRARRRRGGHEESAGRARGGAGGGGRGATGGPGGGDDGEGDGDLAIAVDRHLARLPEDLRTPLVLRYHEGFTHEEVAAALGIAPGTASSRLRRGLERLRASLSRSGLAAAIPPLERLLARAPALPPCPAPPLAAALRARVLASAQASRVLPLVAGSSAAVIAGAFGAWLALGGARDPGAGAIASGPAGGARSTEAALPEVVREARMPRGGPGEADREGAGASEDQAMGSSTRSGTGSDRGAGDRAAAPSASTEPAGAPAPERAAAPPAEAPSASARDALARAVAKLGEGPLVALDLTAERGGEPRSARVAARPATGELRVANQGGYPLSFGYDGQAWWISWDGAGEVLRRVPVAGSPYDYVRLAREEALGLTAEMLPVFEDVAFAADEVEDGVPVRVVRFRVARAEGLAKIDPARERLLGFELRTPADGGPLFLGGRYAYPSEGDLPPNAFGEVPAGEDAAWRVAETDVARAVIVRVDRDRLGRIELQGFIEGAPPALGSEAAADARGRDDRGVAYRGLAPRLAESQTENDLASWPAFGTPFRALYAPEEGEAARALEARAADLGLAGLTFRAVRLPEPRVDALGSVEPGDVASPGAEPERAADANAPGAGAAATADPVATGGAAAGRAMQMCFPAEVLFAAVPGLAPEERDAILAASRAGRLTIEAVAETVGAKRAAAVRKRFPIIQPGLRLAVLEREPSLPYMLLRTPGAGDRITIRPARIRELFPAVPETAVAELIAEGRAGRLTVARLDEVVLGGKRLPGPSGTPLAKETPVALLEP